MNDNTVVEPIATEQLIGEAAAANALCQMAARRGLHATQHEAELTWRSVHGEDFQQKFDAAWAWLFRGHSIERIPVSLAHNAQLPAWVFQQNAVGIATRLADDAQPLQVEWLGVAPADAGAIATLWVPVSPGLIEQESMVPEKKRGPATEAILTALRDHLPLFKRVGMVSVLINVLAIFTSLFAMQVYDRVVPNLAYATLWVLSSGMLLTMLFDVALKWVRLKLLEASALRLDEALSLYFFEKLMALKLDRRPPRIGTLVAQIRDYESVKNFFTSSTLFALADLPFVLMFIAVIAMIGGPVALVLLVFVPVGILIGLASYRPMAKLQKEQTDESARRTGLLFETVSGAEVIKSQGGEPRFSDAWLRATRESGDIGARIRNVTAYSDFAVNFCQQLSYVSVLIVGVYTIESGTLTLGGLIACSILSTRALSGISKVASLLLQWHHARHSLEVLDTLLSRPTDDDPKRLSNTRVAALDLELAEVKYSYEGVQTPQLSVPALTIKAGERIAIIGRNGSGKTTLVKLLAGIGTPNAGEVRIAGLDMQRCRSGWLREVIGYLPQDVRLFSGTLAENLTLGLTMPDEARIREAMERTGLLHAVNRHPLGLNLPIREGGSGLSGGQRQMVGLTRLVLQDPKIWLLDEPSSSLDREGEQRLLNVLRELPRDRTVIFTSHRQGWLALADRVLLMEDGVVKSDAPASKVRAIQNNVTAKAALGANQSA